MLVKISDAEWLVLKCERDREEKNGRTTLTERARETEREREQEERGKQYAIKSSRKQFNPPELFGIFLYADASKGRGEEK